jgi:diphthine-ammonia ligase
MFVKLNGEFGFHICGEGGEFETATLDSPLYKQKIEIVEQEVV